ncbi:MAG TPA: uroporphyrinogen-III synthase [Anaerolineales bacterium]|nr:uroporphyrinogen-III synthase [Anaerolineales bacterium]
MRVLVTRPPPIDAPVGDPESEGFTPIYFPTIRISPPADPRPLDEALQRLPGCAWAVFTSANAVEAVREGLDRIGRSFPTNVRVAAIGPQTAARLESQGIAVDYLPAEFISDAVVPGLGDLAGMRVFLPLGDLAENTIPDAVAAAGGIPEIVTAYHTLPADPDPDGLAALRAGVDAIAFTSGSTAANFAALVRVAGLDPFRLPGDPLIACIGPKTAAAARSAGFRVDLVAEEHTFAGLVSALKEASVR